MAEMQGGIDEARRVGIAEAKANLSGMVADVEHTGVAYVIERYGRAVALLAPLPERRHRSGGARGTLSSYADAAKRDLEAGAFARAMEAKHEHVA